MDDDQLETLCARVQRGEAGAFEQLVGATASGVHRVALRLMLDADEADDVAQETFVRLYEALNRGSYQELGRLQAWLRRVATRVALDTLRSGGRRRAREAAVGPQPAEQSAVGEARVGLREVQALLGGLPESQRVALVLKELEGMTTREVAEAMECSEGAVEQRLVRGRTALRARWNDDG